MTARVGGFDGSRGCHDRFVSMIDQSQGQSSCSLVQKTAKIKAPGARIPRGTWVSMFVLSFLLCLTSSGTHESSLVSAPLPRQCRFTFNWYLLWHPLLFFQGSCRARVVWVGRRCGRLLQVGTCGLDHTRK